MNKLLILFMLLLTGCASVGTLMDNEQNIPYSLEESYRARPEDIVKVFVLDNQDVSGDFIVSTEGFIQLPLVGNVKVKGMTGDEINNKIKIELSRYIKNVKVNTSLISAKTNEKVMGIKVGGSVSKPSIIPYYEGMKVLDSIIEAGGPTEMANPNGTSLHRKNNGKEEVYSVKLGTLLSGNDMVTNYYLQPGDTIIVPEKIIPVITTIRIDNIIGVLGLLGI